MLSIDIPRPTGSIIRHFSIKSQIIAQTSAGGFSAVRPHVAYVPAASARGEKLPTVYLLASWMGAGRSMFNWEPHREDLATRLDRLIDSKVIPPCVVICPDLYVDYGGSQYINSAWVGHHSDHIVKELIPFVEANFPVLPGSHHRAALGRSSGGFGALRLVMDYDDSFGAAACHAGDMGFEWVYRRSLIDICVGLAKLRDPQVWLDELRKQKKLSGFDTHILMMLGMCAFYSPNPSAPLGFDIPISIRNGEIIEHVWQRWLAHDPLNRLDDQQVIDRLGRLKTMYLDCGNRDQYFLQYGARQFSAKAERLGIKHTYAEFDDNHSGTSYRFDESLPKLLAVIAPVVG
jgi:S-formylglutathione hydrolase FrmB